MSADEMQRARDVITALCETHVFLADDLSPIAEQDLADLIASAIREAEASARNEALEEAAVLLETGVTDVRRFHGASGTTSSPWAASVVRNLKTKD